MKEKITKGLNILIGNFTDNTNTNGERVKAVICEINNRIGFTYPKEIIPMQYGYESIMYHINNDDENTVIVINIDARAHEISDHIMNKLISIAKDLRGKDIDKYVVYCFDMSKDNPSNSRYDEQIYKISGIYDKDNDIIIRV